MPTQAPARMGDDAGMRLLMPVGRSLWAIAAGYAGLFSFIILPGPIALILALLAIRDIQRSKAAGAPKYGMGRAIFGLVMGILATLVLVGMIVVSLTKPDHH